MQDKLIIPFPVIVEGKYDKIRLTNVIDAQILTTEGFGIFNNSEKRRFLQKLSQRSKIIVLTDSDGGGGVIRSHLSGILPPDKIIMLYTPQISGKETRKKKPSAGGLLGVEGMTDELLYRLFLPLADTSGESHYTENTLTTADLFKDGLTGSSDSRQKRDELCRALDLPCGMTAKALLHALRYLVTREQYDAVLSGLTGNTR